MIVLAAMSAACGSADTVDPVRERPVQGRVDTTAGVSFDFPAGWADMPLGSRPFTKFYENAGDELDLALGEFSSNGQSLAALADNLRNRLGASGNIVSSGNETLGGHPAYRLVVTTIASGGNGLLIAFVVERARGRVTSIYLSTKGAERPGQRAKMETLLGSAAFID
jgi:hypothetical protein